MVIFNLSSFSPEQQIIFYSVVKKIIWKKLNNSVIEFYTTYFLKPSYFYAVQNCF